MKYAKTFAWVVALALCAIMGAHAQQIVRTVPASVSPLSSGTAKVVTVTNSTGVISLTTTSNTLVVSNTSSTDTIYINPFGTTATTSNFPVGPNQFYVFEGLPGLSSFGAISTGAGTSVGIMAH